MCVLVDMLHFKNLTTNQSLAVGAMFVSLLYQWLW